MFLSSHTSEKYLSFSLPRPSRLSHLRQQSKLLLFLTFLSLSHPFSRLPSPSIPIPVRILHKRAENSTPRLQQRMSDDNLQKPLQTPPAILNDTIIKAIDVHLPRQRRDTDASRLALEEIAKHLKIRVSSSHFGAAQFEGGDVGGEADEVGSVAAVGRRGGLDGQRVGDFDFEKVFGHAVDFFKGLRVGFAAGAGEAGGESPASALFESGWSVVLRC